MAQPVLQGTRGATSRQSYCLFQCMKGAWLPSQLCGLINLAAKFATFPTCPEIPACQAASTLCLAAHSDQSLLTRIFKHDRVLHKWLKRSLRWCNRNFAFFKLEALAATFDAHSCASSQIVEQTGSL